ncbi:hypothetical protein VaNZ11_000589 [Volvox africanus]|uniref:Uncharacterized protein n=1 Tax=Volvox africanus TaxID=51714 RepID=A0ABQ5RMP1_9CHLO|nr:hypothetical protein VaNZ11_000589 [Volvox africanus]
MSAGYMTSNLHAQRLYGLCRHRQLFLALVLICFVRFRISGAVGRLQLKESADSFQTRYQHDCIGSATLCSLRRSARRLTETAQPKLAATYMDSLLADFEAARKRLVGNFNKRSKVAVVYMCFERMEMIQQAMPAILRSDGLADFDFFISQDGGSRSIFDVTKLSIPSGTQYVFIHHPANLCAGLHHYFVKAFAFDIMGYDTLLVVEEDNVIHPQALQLLHRMAELSISEPEIGVVSLLDMDMSHFLDPVHYSEGLIRTVGTVGHLWVFGLHRSKYDAVRGYLRGYYEVIKGHDYRMKHEPPLRDAIVGLLQENGMEDTSVLSQDRWFIFSLAKSGFALRYQTLFRFFEPIGYYGLHFQYNQSQFFGVFGRGMFNGRIKPAAAFDVTKDPAHGQAIKATMRARLTTLYDKYWSGSPPPEGVVEEWYHGVLEGRLNGLEALQDVMRGKGLLQK